MRHGVPYCTLFLSNPATYRYESPGRKLRTTQNQIPIPRITEHIWLWTAPSKKT